jgi:hypothetical protein
MVHVISRGGARSGSNVIHDADGKEVEQEDVTSVTVVDGVEEIGKKAFCGCVNLRTVQLPKTVAVIGDNAFKACTKLTNIAVPEAAIIGDKAFLMCTALYYGQRSHKDIPAFLKQRHRDLNDEARPLHAASAQINPTLGQAKAAVAAVHIMPAEGRATALSSEAKSGFGFLHFAAMNPSMPAEVVACLATAFPEEAAKKDLQEKVPLQRALDATMPVPNLLWLGCA